MIKRVSEIESRPCPKDNLLSYTWCLLEEVEFDHRGVGGNTVTPEILKALTYSPGFDPDLFKAISEIPEV